MKIAIIGCIGLPPRIGGMQKVVEEIAQVLSNLGCKVTVFSRSYYSEIKKNKFNYKNFEVVNIHKAAFIDFVQEILDLGEKVSALEIWRSWIDVETFENYRNT